MYLSSSLNTEGKTQSLPIASNPPKKHIIGLSTKQNTSSYEAKSDISHKVSSIHHQNSILTFPKVLGQILPRCDCLLSRNFYVKELDGIRLDYHFDHESGKDEKFRQRYKDILYDFPPSFVDGILNEIEKERNRRKLKYFTPTDETKQKCKAHLCTIQPNNLDLTKCHLEKHCVDETFLKMCATSQQLLDKHIATSPLFTKLEQIFEKFSKKTINQEFKAFAIELDKQIAILRTELLAQYPSIEVLDQNASPLYAFRVFTDAFCDELVQQFTLWGTLCKDVKGQPNTMNKMGVLMEETDLTEPFSNPLFSLMRPLSVILFGSVALFLDNHRTFTVHYKAAAGMDRKLSLHYDNAEVTANIGLSNTFAGGDLILYGNHSGEKYEKPMTVKHRKGVALMHLGVNLHKANEITEGSRSNLVMWMRGTQYREACGCAMCGELCKRQKE